MGKIKQSHSHLLRASDIAKPTHYYFDANSTGERRAPCLACQRTNTHEISGSSMQITDPAISRPAVDESIGSSQSDAFPSLAKSRYVASAAEAVRNYRENPAGIWYKDNIDPNDPGGRYAFQRLRQTCFIPHVVPRFKLCRADKFYAIGSCFARGIEKALAGQNVIVESAAPELAKLQPANTETSGLGFTNKYNTYSILNELRWALDPEAEFPRDSVVPLTKTKWYDPHTNPTLEFVDLEQTLERRALMQAVTKRVAGCRGIIVTLGLAEVWRDAKANVFVNRTPIPSLFKSDPDRYEFHLSSFADNWANLEAIYELLTRYGHPDFHVIVTVSPVPLMNTFSTMDIVVANAWAKSLLRAVAQEWAMAHPNVDYFSSYEIVQNSDRATVWEKDLRHVTGPVVQQIMKLFVRNYIE
jgi:GSCFA family